MPITYDIKKDALYKQGIEIGIEKGVEIGTKKFLENVAINCFNQGKSYEEIAIMTGLTISQVKENEKAKSKKN